MDLKNELYNWEVNPPEDAWNRISQDLDNEFLNVKKRLGSYEEIPPPSVWNRVAAKLNIGQSLEIPAPSRWNRKSFYRMAVAAAIAAFVITGVEYLFFRTRNPQLIENQNAALPLKLDTVLARPDNSNPITANAGGLKNLISKLVTPKRNPPKATTNDSPTEAQIIPVSETSLNPPEVAPQNLLVVDEIGILTDHFELNTLNKQVKDRNGEVSDDINIRDLMNSYFILTNGAGEDVRVSSKFKSLKGLFSPGNNNRNILGMILSGNDYWNEIMSAWQQKLLNSSYMPSSQNFMDIQELMTMLREETK